MGIFFASNWTHNSIRLRKINNLDFNQNVYKLRYSKACIDDDVWSWPSYFLMTKFTDAANILKLKKETRQYTVKKKKAKFSLATIVETNK